LRDLKYAQPVTAAALYYPHWGVANPRFLFEALLYWDQLACIVPYEEFRPRGYAPGELQHGVELMHESFVTGLAPTEAQKASVHDTLKELLDFPAPDRWRMEDFAPSGDAVIAMRKLSPDTVRMLIEHSWMLAGDELSGWMPEAVAGLVLGAIAREMSSDTMPPVTDERQTFKATCNGLLRELQARQGIGVSPGGDYYPLGGDRLDPGADVALVLARITKLGIHDEGITPGMFERLHRLRLDTGFNEQRKRFREQVDCYVADLREHPITEHRLIHAHWATVLASDRESLRRELEKAGIQSLTEREGWLATGIAIAAGTGSFAAMAGAPPVLLIGVGLLAAYAITDRLRKRRNELKDGHWTSWLAAACDHPWTAF
jgi:hypothetical protein